MSFFQDSAMRAEAGLRIERLQREFPARRPRRWRRADRAALVAAEVRAVIEAHIRVPEQRLPDQLPQSSLARPGQ